MTKEKGLSNSTAMITIYTKICCRDNDRENQSLAHQPEIHPHSLIFDPH